MNEQDSLFINIFKKTFAFFFKKFILDVRNNRDFLLFIQRELRSNIKRTDAVYLIAKKLIKVKYISLVNLIMDREVVKELIQDELNEENLKSELRKILIGGVKRRRMLDDFQELKVLLGNKGASEKTAKLILEYLNK